MKTLLWALWHIAATLGITALWSRHPEALPPPPSGFIDWALTFHGIQNGEDLSTMETNYMLAVSFIVVVATSGLIRYFMRVSRRFHWF